MTTGRSGRLYPLLFAAFAATSAAPAPAQTADPPGATYHVAGVTAYDPAEILGFAAHLAAERSGTVSAEALAAAIRTIYHEDGHFLAEVFVAADGRTLIVDEGVIGDVVIEGVDAATFRLIRSYVAPVVGTPAVTLDAFERAIMLVEDIGGISATAEIDYAPGADTASLRIVATGQDRSAGRVTLDHPARDLGEAATVTVEQSFLGALTPGDMLRFEIAGTRDFDSGDRTLFAAGTYRFPIAGAGAYGEAYLGNVTARRDARGALLETDIAGNTAILALGYPVLRDVERYGYALFDLRRSETDVDVGAAAFDSAVEVVGGSWIFGKTIQGGGAYEYALNLSAGRRTTTPAGFDDGDETFWHLRFGAGFSRPVTWLGPETSLRAEVWGQYSPDRLPAIEEFHLGGREDERGYVFAEAQGDSGLSATVELGRDLFPASGPAEYLRPFGFLDAGFVRNNDPSAGEIRTETLASVGIGIDAGFAGNLHMRSHLSVPLSDGPRTGAGDPALYLSLTKSW